MLQGISIFALFLWIYSGESETVFFSSTATIISNEILFQLTFIRLFISNFWFSHFAPATQEKDALQRMMTLSH